MSIGGRNPLEGMGELLLSLVWKHCNSEQWATWLQIVLQGAARGGDAEMVTELLKADAPSTSLRSVDDLTPLHSAALGGSLDVVSSLLQDASSRDVNKTTQSNHDTPLHLAVKQGHAGVALALVRAGGSVHLTDAHGWTPLMRAASDGRAELVNDLLLWGSQVDVASTIGDQALHMATRRGHLGAVKVLLQARASPGTRGENGMSPFDWAAKDGNTDIMFELFAPVASVPDVGVLDDCGESAMSLAMRHEHPEAIDMLVNAGMDLGFPLEGEKSPLHLACYYLWPRSVQALLRRDADEIVYDDDYGLPHVLGQGILEEERDEAVVGDILKMLERAPADRVWRRRGWLAMLNARKRATDEEHRSKDHEDGAENKKHDEADPPSGVSSRRKLADGGAWATDDAVHVHPTRKRLHWAVTKIVDVADELIFRNVVSYL